MSTENLPQAREILQRLFSLWNCKTDNDLADVLEIPRGTLGSWRSRGNLDWPKIFAKCNGISIDWLLTGTGPMRRGESAGPAEGEYVTVPYRRQSASAGHGALVEDRQDEPRRMAFRRDWIDNHLHTTRGGLFLMAARGESMVPEIKNGDILLVDSNQTKIRTGDVYVWTYGEGENHEVIVKKANRRIENGEEIVELISENKDFQGEDRVIADKNRHLFKNEGRVVWIGRTLE